MVDRVKLRYRLTPDPDGWPPVASEDLWAVLVSPDVARVDSIPWFVQNVALGDLIRVSGDQDGLLKPLEKLRWSGNCTIRVVSLLETDANTQLRGVMEELAEFGVSGEVLQQYEMVALNVPASADVSRVKAFLDRGETDGIWSYDEGCIGGRWPS
jgi:hypothetical protein